MHRSTALLGITSLAICAVVAQFSDAQDNRPRPIAPGVLVTIPPDINPDDMTSLPGKLPGVEAAEYNPETFPKEETLWGQTRRVVLHRDFIWEYEFSFIGLRQARLKVPGPDGDIQNKNFWYLIYRIRNTNATMAFNKVKDPANEKRFNYELQRGVPIGDREVDFRPRFSLEGYVERNGQYEEVAYGDIINPIAVEQIRQLEDPNQRLLDSRQMANVTIPVAENDADPGVWGVAIWEDVDPRIDFVRVYVRGLSNAYQLGKDLNSPDTLKTLQLNFWRPGDRIAERRDAVIYGIPLVEEFAEQATICKRYHLPGPVIQVLEFNNEAKRNVLVAEIDAQIDLETLKSDLTPTLDSGKLPATLVENLQRSGITIDQNAAVNTTIPGASWAFQDAGTNYVVRLKPQFWEPRFGKIRFIKSLDHLWIYR